MNIIWPLGHWLICLEKISKFSIFMPVVQKSLKLPEEGIWRGKFQSLVPGNWWQDAQRCSMGGSDWTLGKIYLLSGWSSTGTGFLYRWLMPYACLCSRGIWIMPLLYALKGQPWSAWAGGLDDLWRSLPIKLSYIDGKTVFEIFQMMKETALPFFR